MPSPRSSASAHQPVARAAGLPVRLGLAVFAAVLAAVTLGGAAVTAQRGYHVESGLGFRVKVPPKWERYPAEKHRRFERGVYVPNKPYPVRGIRGGHHPTMRVLVWPKAAATAARKLAEEKGAQLWVAA